MGNPVLHPGHNSQDIAVANIVANGPAPRTRDPGSRCGRQPSRRSRSSRSKLAERCVSDRRGARTTAWPSSSRISSPVVEAPLNEERSLAVIAEVKKLIPEQADQHIS